MNKDANKDYVDFFSFNGSTYNFYSIRKFLNDNGVNLAKVPYSAKLIIEYLLRKGNVYNAIKYLNSLAVGVSEKDEFSFLPVRIIMQDYTGIPALLDIATLQEEGIKRGINGSFLSPRIKTDVIVDHSLLVDYHGDKYSLSKNEALEESRNRERYEFLSWAESAFDKVNVIPSGNGIVHQINMEYLATLIEKKEEKGEIWIFPDSVIGTDSHTTMINGLGIFAWGVGGLEAESIMMGLPVSALIPEIININLHGKLSNGVFAADVALTLTHYLRKIDVVGKIIEFTGDSVNILTAEDRCTIANMAPEYGAKCAMFPLDEQVIQYFSKTGRKLDHIEMIIKYYKHQGLWSNNSEKDKMYSMTYNFDLGMVNSSLAGPHHPHQLIVLNKKVGGVEKTNKNNNFVKLNDGDIVLAAITSCTNTSNPRSMIAAGLLAKRAVELGIRINLNIKTSLAPGSKAVTAYLQSSGLLTFLEKLGFYIVGYGCTSCNGGAGNLVAEVEEILQQSNLNVASVLSGNRNFTGRVHPLIDSNFLCSPPLVVAYALNGRIDTDLYAPDAFVSESGLHYSLADLWPDDEIINLLVSKHVHPQIFKTVTPLIKAKKTQLVTHPFKWDPKSTYIKKPEFFSHNAKQHNLNYINARVLALFGDNISTDHISPVGSIETNSTAGIYLGSQGVFSKDMNTFGSRRSNFEVMKRGAFSNPKIINLILGGRAGGLTKHFPSGDVASIYDIAVRYHNEGIDTVIVAGKNYGIGSSRDWAAKGPWFLGVRAIISEGFENIHRGNLISMGILPLKISNKYAGLSGQLKGDELITIKETSDVSHQVRKIYDVCITDTNGLSRTIKATSQIYTLEENDILTANGILNYILDHVDTSISIEDSFL